MENKTKNNREHIVKCVGPQAKSWCDFRSLERAPGWCLRYWCVHDGQRTPLSSALHRVHDLPPRPWDRHLITTPNTPLHTSAQANGDVLLRCPILASGSSGVPEIRTSPRALAQVHVRIFTMTEFRAGTAWQSEPRACRALRSCLLVCWRCRVCVNCHIASPGISRSDGHETSDG